MNASISMTRFIAALRTVIFFVVFGFAVLVTITWGPASLLAAESPNETVPPLERFVYDATPDSVKQGQTVNYDVTIVSKDDHYVNVVLGFKAKLPSGVTVLPDSIRADSGVAAVTAAGEVTWTGRIIQPQTILISFQATVATNTCGSKVSRAVLYEIENDGADGPSSQQIARTTEFAVEGECLLYLPNLMRAPLSAIPHLLNWDFEQGPDAPGWGQFDNDKSSKLIYSTEQKQINPPPAEGKWFGWLGGLPNNTSELRQPISLPVDHSGLQLRFRYMIGSVDECGAGDRGYVMLGGAQIGPNYDLCKDRADVWKEAQISIPAESLDKQVDLVLAASTNASKNSNWFVDNVKFCSTDERAAIADRCN